MKRISAITFGCLIFFLVPFALAAEDLDKLYGTPEKTEYIKYYEVDETGKVLLNPYLQVASKQYPGILDPKRSPYNWTINAKGQVGFTQENLHPYGRIYKTEWIRPEDTAKRKPGSSEEFGHTSAVAGKPARIGGEFLYDKRTKSWTINNKSGRYSRGNTDRTPQQLMNAVKLIKEVIDPGPGVSWSSVIYILYYAPDKFVKELESNRTYYDLLVSYPDAEKKGRPQIFLYKPDCAPGSLGDDDPS